MYFATKIKMKHGCYNSNDLTEIDQVYINGSGWCDKSYLHDYLKSHPHTIKVNYHPYPYLIPRLSSHYEKYVCSEANYTTKDNLLSLPRV